MSYRTRYRRTARLGVLACALTIVGCGPQPAPQPAAPPYKLSASVQELMESIVDPAADRVWESVGTTVTEQGVEARQPQSDEEWLEVRKGVITLLEATNLLMMPGRQMVPPGGKMLDEGSEGVLTAAEAQQRLDSQSAVFVQFATSLRDVVGKVKTAVDEKNADALFELGAEMDEVCEGCHLTFWYPGQPVFRVQKSPTAPER